MHKIKEKFKLSLCQSTTFSQPYEIGPKNPIFELISSFDEVSNLLENMKNENIFKLFYFNKDKINDALYDDEEIIQLNQELIKNDLSYYFYLFLLIGEDSNMVNYQYSIDIIKNINDELEKENDNIFKSLITSKLILELIKNYKELDYYDEKKDGEELSKIENNILTKINYYIENLKQLNINLDEKTILNNNIDKIYIDIINDLIKSKKFEKYEECKEIIEQIEIEKINITKTMYDELFKSLNINEDNMKKYFISGINDFLDEKKINFYFILLKYIIKSNIYIYQIPFLLQSKKNFLKLIKSNSNVFPINLNDNEKLKYIFNFITDSKYYNNKLSNYNNFNRNDNTESTIKKVQNINTNNSQNNIIKSTRIQTILSQLSTDNEDNFKILILEDIINRNKYYSSSFIKQTHNGYFITGGSDDDTVNIYDKDFKFKRMLKYEIPDIAEKVIQTQTNSNQIKSMNYKITQNIFETNDSIKNKGNNKIEIIECSKYGMLIYSIDLNNNINDNIRKTVSNPFYVSCSGCLEINNNYLLYGEKGLFHFHDKPFNLNINYDQLEKYRKSNYNYKGGIKINDNLIALTSNQILPKGQDFIIFYDINKQKILNYYNSSFVNGVNGLILLEINKENIKILLCACKKYIDGQENGILLINPDIKENENISVKMKSTDEFEVNCFCQINFIGNKGIIKSNYFFAGGFDNEKRQGLIKLYRVVFEKEKEIDIEFLEDIYFDGNDKVTEGFEGTINCIVQSTNNGKILASCWDKKIYAFSKPNIDYYLEEEKDLSF